MTDIQRWDMNHVQGEVYIDKNPEGSWVTFTDAEAAIAAAREDALAAAVQRVEAYEYISTIGVTLSSVVPKAAVIAAIKGDAIDALRKDSHERRGYETGHAAALDAAEKTITAIPAEYKVRGDHNSYGSYAEGKADFKDLALSAIDTLRKEQQ